MGGGNEPGDVGLAQPDEVDPPGRRLPTQLRHRGRHRVVGRQCDIAVRAQNQQPRIPHLAREKLQEQEGGGVSGVEIFQHNNQRLTCRSAQQERRDRVEQLEPRRVGVDVRRRRKVSKRAADLGQQLSDVHRCRPDRLPHRLGVSTAEIGSHDLYPRPVRWCASGLPASPRGHRNALFAGPSCHLVGQTALSDPRLSAQQEQASMPSGSVVEPSKQFRHLTIPPNKSGCPSPMVHVTDAPLYPPRLRVPPHHRLGSRFLAGAPSGALTGSHRSGLRPSVRWVGGARRASTARLA